MFVCLFYVGELGPKKLYKALLYFFWLVMNHPYIVFFVSYATGLGEIELQIYLN